MKETINEIPSVFTSSEVKDLYIKNGMNPLSANYFIKKNIDSGNFTKIQNGLYYKNGIDLQESSLSTFLKGKNNNDFGLVDAKTYDKLRISNAMLETEYIITNSPFYKKNENLFNFLKKSKKVKVIIISNNRFNDISFDQYAKVFTLTLTNTDDEEYFTNAKNILKKFTLDKLNLIIKNLRIEYKGADKIKEVYYGEI